MDNNSINFHNIIDGIEQDYKAKKMKESILLLKRKMCKTHDLIKQYSENMKEIDHLKSDLEIAKKEAKHTISNYKSAMDKIRELELKIVDDKQNNEKLINKLNEYEINIAADKQSIQQLTCKIQNLEREHSDKVTEYELQKSTFEDKIKDLEHELKKLKTVHKKREKKIIFTNFDMAKPSIDTKSSSDIGINVSLCDIESSVKHEVQNKSVMTDEFYNMKDDPHPLFCAKCEAHLPPDLTPEKIYKTMTTYPKLIEKDLSPLSKKIYSPSCSLSSTYLGSTIRNEDAVFKMSSTSHLSPHSPYNDSVVGNLKSQSGRSSMMTPICENIELKNVDISHIPVVTNLSNNLSSIPTVFTLSQNTSCAREDFCSDNLLTKHSSAIKEIERKFRSLESKISRISKKFRRLKKKINTNSRCCCTNHNNDISLNSNLISIICKGIAEYFHEKKEACSKNERDIDSKMCTCCTKNSQLQNRQHSNKYNAHKNTFSWKIENLDEKDQMRDTCCSKTENGTKANDILQFEHTLSSVHKNNSYLDINTSNTSLNDIDETDKGEFVLQHQNTLHSAEVASVKNSLATSCLIADKIYVNDNFLSEDNVKVIDQTKVGMIFLSNDENSTDHTDDKTVDINAEKNKIKRKNQSKHKDKVSEIYASDNLLSKDIEATVETIVDTDNQKETKNIFLSNNENSTDGKININTDKIELKRKSQSIHKDNISKIYASNNLLSKNNVEAVDMDNQLETKTIFLSNENFTDDKVVDINIKDKIKVKREGQNIYKNGIDKINTSDNLLNKDNIEARDNQTETETTSLSNNENSTDYTDSKIVDINVEKTKIKRKGQNIQKSKVGDRLLKKIRSLKRKTQANSRINKQETIEPCSNHNSEYNELTKKFRIENEKKISNYPLNHIRNLKRNLDTQAESINKQEDNKLCSDHYEPPKKLRIAHTPKTSILELNINENDTHWMIKNIAALVTRRKNNENQQVDIQKINLLTESEKIHIRNKKCDEKDIVKSVETNDIDRKPVNEKDLDLTSAENCLQNNISPSLIEHVSEFEKCDDVLIEDTINRDTDRITGTLHGHESNILHDNIAIDTTNDLEFENSIPLRTYIITCSKDSKYKKLSEALEKIENRKEMMSTAELEYASKTLGNKRHNDHNDHKILKDMISDEELSILNDQSNMLEATQNESHNSNISPRSPSPRDSGIVEDYTNDNNIKESFVEIKNITNEGEETYVNNETIGIRTIKTRRRNVRASQRDKETKFINTSHVEESQSHNNNDISDEANEVILSPSPKDSDTIFENCINDNNVKESVNEIKNARNKREETCVNNETIEAIQTRNKNICASQQDKETKFIGVSHHDVEKSQMPMSQLIKYINGNHKKKYKLSNKKIKYACKITDKFIKKQLQRLKNNAWEDSIHDDIIGKLENTCRPRIIAKCIVEFLLEQFDSSEALDKSFTPPAPLMTKFEQKIIALLFDLEVSKPTVICFVQAAIEYHLFRFDSNVKVQVDSLTRIYVALSRIQKDREKIRMMCCDAFYCTNLKSIGILYTVLTCWPEVLPSAEANKGILPRCIAFLIGSQQIENASNMKRLLKKLHTLKQLISKFYNYIYIKETINDFVKDLMTALKTERIDGLDTAIILIAKREGTFWTYKNIIQSALLPMIIKNEHPCIYSAFSLLGRLLRAFPLKDNDNIVQEISEQLCDLIQSGQGSHDQQEGIISALLSLSRHKFNVIASSVIEWMPSKPLRPIVDAHLQAFLNAHSSMFWKNYLQNKNIKLIQTKTELSIKLNKCN